MPRYVRLRPSLEVLEERQLLTADIRGIVFEDRDADGRRDSGERGIPGRTVYLDQNANAVLDAREPRTTSGADGAFALLRVPAGQYQVAQVVPPGWTPTRLVVTSSAVTSSSADRLMQLDRFRSDSRFAGIDGRGFTVVVLDTGIAGNHSFFGPDANRDGRADRIRYQYDFVNNDAVAEDASGHGTHISSLIGSSNQKYPGVVPGVDLIMLKVLDESGNGNFANIEKALQWVVANASKYRIASVNLAFGDGGNYARPMALNGVDDELAALAARNITLVAAAGNGHHGETGLPGIMYPASNENVIPVGAVWDTNRGGPWTWDLGVRDYQTGADRIVSFSQRTPNMRELFAPGTFLVGAAPGGATTTESGTSGASALVAGTIALAQQLATERLGRMLSTTEIRSLLERTARTIRDGDDERDNVSNTGANYGRIDVLALGEAILAMGSVNPGPRPGTSLVVVPDGKSVTRVELGSKSGAVNHAPSLSGDGTTTQLQEDSRLPTGTTVASLLGSTFRDVDSLARKGLAVVSSSGQGTWQYSLDGGRTWRAFGLVSRSRALLLREFDRVRFYPNANISGAARLEYLAWDQTSGVAGATMDLSRSGSTGGSTAFSANLARGGFQVVPVNDAPRMSGPGQLTKVPMNAANPRGDLVRTLLTGKVTDVDGPLDAGLVLVGATGNGTWQYSRDGGRTWLTMTDVSPTRGLLLAPTDLVRFVPSKNWVGQARLTYRAWDRTTGTVGGRMDLSSWANVGGTTAFSKELVVAILTVGGVQASA